ncbi:MAG: HAD-IIIA family hydrolase [Legionellales bacterium]|nr:HAD-IIIA family hydrolase [Legionellales bacterium]
MRPYQLLIFDWEDTLADSRYSYHPGHNLLFPHAEKILRNLHQAGYLLAVATGKTRVGLDLALRATELQALFTITRCADESLPKPYPQMIEEILVFCDVEPQGAVMIGDSIYDMQMAVNANIVGIGMMTDRHSEQALLEAGATFCCNDLMALESYLLKLST